MKVRTIKKHGNSYPPQFIKNHGRKYEPSDRDAKNLIAAGLVEADEPQSDAVGED